MVRKGHLIGLAVCISAVIAGGCTPRTTGQDRTAQTQTVATIGAEAEKEALLKHINREFEDPEAHYRLGQIYQAESKWDEAEYHYNTALSFDPVHWPARAAKVKMLQQSGRANESKQAAALYISEVSASAERSLPLGLEFQKQGFDDYAMACYQQALRLAPNSAKVNKQLGYYYLSKTDKERAKEYFVRSFNLDRLQPDVANQLGLLGVAIEVPRKPPKNTKSKFINLINYVKN